MSVRSKLGPRKSCITFCASCCARRLLGTYVSFGCLEKESHTLCSALPATQSGAEVTATCQCPVICFVEDHLIALVQPHTLAFSLQPCLFQLDNHKEAMLYMSAAAALCFKTYKCCLRSCDQLIADTYVAYVQPVDYLLLAGGALLL